MAYSVKRLAEKWECSERHIYNLIASGHLESFSIGTRRGTRISDEEVSKWESKQKCLTETEKLPSDNQMASTLLASIT